MFARKLAERHHLQQLQLINQLQLLLQPLIKAQAQHTQRRIQLAAKDQYQVLVAFAPDRADQLIIAVIAAAMFIRHLFIRHRVLAVAEQQTQLIQAEQHTLLQHIRFEKCSAVVSEPIPK